ncbi:MAG: DUF3168 domain-containing protein [Sphingobium sp.]
MDFHSGLRARLRTDTTVAAIVGTRVDWMVRPEKDALPSVTLQTVSDPRPQHLKGMDGARPTRVQIDCWAATYVAALDLARAVIAVLSVPATISGKRFGNAQVEGQRDLGETVSDGSFIHRQSVDFVIWHIGD